MVISRKTSLFFTCKKIMGVANDDVPTVVEHPANSGEEMNEMNILTLPVFFVCFLQYVKSLTFA